MEDLKKALGDNMVKTEEMQRELREAQQREHTALEQLHTAIQRADEMSARAQTAQQNVENRENIILTFKNKDGKVLEIKSLEEFIQQLKQFR